MNLILAGTHNEYSAYCKANKLNPAEHRYIHRPVDVLRYVGIEVVMIGNWWVNPACEEVFRRESAGLLTVRRSN